MIQKPPRSPCVINRAHPHAKGQKVSFLFNDYGCSAAHDYSNGYRDAALVGGATLGAGGLLCNSSGEYGHITDGNQLIDLNAGTVIITLKSLSIASDNKTRYLFGNTRSGSGKFYISKHLDNTLRCYFIGVSASHYIIVSHTKLLNWTTNCQLAFVWDLNNVVAFGYNMGLNVNGVFVAPDSANRAISWTPTLLFSDIIIGNSYADTTIYSNSIIKSLSIYDYALTESLLKGIYQNPYDMVIR